MTFRSAALELPVADVGLAVDFYEQKLGFQRRNLSDDSAVVTRDGVDIRLWSAKELEARLAQTERDLDGGEPKVAGSASGRIRVRGLRELYRQCQDGGIVHPNGALDRVESWGLDEFAVLDRDCNCLSFYEPVAPHPE